jgi:hypothetical protein
MSIYDSGFTPDSYATPAENDYYRLVNWCNDSATRFSRETGRDVEIMVTEFDTLDHYWLDVAVGGLHVRFSDLHEAEVWIDKMWPMKGANK